MQDLIDGIQLIPIGFRVFFFMILGVFGLAIIEAILRWQFPQFYFRLGIPITRRTSTIVDLQFSLTHLASEHFEATERKPHIKIRHFSENEYGLWANEMLLTSHFRSRMQSYNPLTHGLLKIENENHLIKLMVYLRLSSAVLIISWLGLSFMTPVFPFNVIFIAFGTFIFFKLYKGEHDQYLVIWETIERMATGHLT